MKFEIYNKSDESRKVVRLKLKIDEYDGNAALITVDENGDHANTLLELTTDGFIDRITYVDDSYGFKLDANGRIRIKTDD